MGKEGDLWDDSALIDAFDSAMSKYKRMHGHGKNSSTETSASVAVHQSSSDEAVIKDVGENSNAVSDTSTQRAESAEEQVHPVKENHPVQYSHTPEPCSDSSNNLPLQNEQGSNQDYNQLLAQYYEVEDKRQKILQQLHQFGDWNYQYPAEDSGAAAQWGTSCISQEYPTPTNQASHSTVVCSCCPYVCQSSVTPCTSYPCCSLGAICVGKASTEDAALSRGNLSAAIDRDIVKTAMGAAERAISSMTTEACTDPNTNEENLEKKDGQGEMSQSTSRETDLTVLLNAWYSAGFHTGKYLVEQNLKKRH